MKNLKSSWLIFQSPLEKYSLFCLKFPFLFFLLFFITACLKTHSQLQKEKEMDLEIPKTTSIEYTNHYNDPYLSEEKQRQKPEEINTPSSLPERNPTHFKNSPPSFSEQQQRALIDSRFYGIDKDFRELYGRIETMEQKLSQIRKLFKNKSGEEPAGDSENIQKIKEKINTLEKALLALDQKINPSSGEETKTPSPKKEAVTEKDSKKETKKKKNPLKERESEKKSDEKEKKDKDPFSQAESFFKKKEYEEAIVRYDKYRKSRPKGKNYPKATFQLGLCFQKLNMDEDAKAFYKELTQRFPKNPLSSKARKILKHLKKKQD